MPALSAFSTKNINIGRKTHRHPLLLVGETLSFTVAALRKLITKYYRNDVSNQKGVCQRIGGVDESLLFFMNFNSLFLPN